MIAITALTALLPLLAAAAPLEQRATGIRINFNGDESKVGRVSQPGHMPF